MSAWIVSDKHISYLVSAAIAYSENFPLSWFTYGTAENAPVRIGELLPREPYDDMEREMNRRNQVLSPNQIGQLLWNENYRSVNSRYHDKDLTPVYSFKKEEVDPVITLKLIVCYEYQSCEHPGWYDSEARQFCSALKSATINAIPGYVSAPWGID